MDMQSKHHSEESARPEGVLLLINLKSGGAKERGVVSSSVLSATAAHLELSPSKRSPPRRVQFLDFLWKGPANSLLSRDPGFRLPGAALTKSERQRRPIERKMRGESYLKLLASEDGGDGKSSTRQGTDTRYSEGTASILSCTINLANTCIGTGMFGLPAAFASSGYALGSLLLMAACMFAANGLRLLTMSAEKVGIRSDRPASFYSIASAALPQFTVAIDFAVALKCFGVATSYLITVGDCMVEAIRYVFQNHLDHMDSTAHSAASSFVASRQFWVLSAVIMVIPMSFHGTLDALHCASTLSLFLTYAVATGIILYAEGILDPCEGKSMLYAYYNNTTLSNDFTLQGESFPQQARQLLQSTNETIATFVSNNTTTLSSSKTVCQGEIQAWNDASATLRNIAIFVFSFCCHQNIFPVVNEIKDRTQPRVDSVVTGAMCSAFLLYFVVAVEGYLTFGKLVSGDILLSYPETAPVTIMRLAIAVMVMLSYPLQLDPSRRSIMSLIRVIREYLDKRRRNKSTALRDEEDELSCSLHATSRIPGESSVRSRARLDVPAATRNVADALEKAVQKSEPQELFTKAEEKFLFNAITCVFLALSLSSAMVVKDLGIVLAIVGATGSTMVRDLITTYGRLSVLS